MGISVTAAPAQSGEHYRRDIGELPVCQLSSYNDAPWDCQGGAEIAVRIRRAGSKNQDVELWICRRCASDLAAELRGAIEMVDAQEVFGS
jgi:hypothetical protein